MIVIPKWGTTRMDYSNVDTSTVGITLTADGATTHTKGPYTTLIASSAFDAYGLTVLIGAAGVAVSTNIRRLVDISVGAAAAEQVLAPNLDCGNTGTWGLAAGGLAAYMFPVFIAAGTRISGRCQANTTSGTVNALIFLHSTPIGPYGWTGSRITAYGADTANSQGTSNSPGNASYSTDSQITASCDNPVKYLQVGQDMLADTTGATLRGILRIGVGATPHYVAQHLPFQESTTIETLLPVTVNSILAGMAFDIPAATRLTVGAMRNGTAEGRGYILYGVD